MRISFVIPALNESESLETLTGEIADVCARHRYDYELVMVDDGSSDDTWKTIAQLAKKRGNVKGIRFRRNFGKAAALEAGFSQCDGDVWFMMDADLQDDPADVPKFLEAIQSGFDVVSGWRRSRRDKGKKILASRIFNQVVSWVTGVRLRDHNCGFKAFRKDAMSEIPLYGELHRFITVLCAAQGFKVGEVEVNHRFRVHGKSRYGLRRFFYGFFDLLTVKFLTSFRQRPMHLLGYGGMGLVFVGGGGLCYLAGLWLATGGIGFRPLMFYSISALIVGSQFLALGILGEMIAASEARSSRDFSVRDVIGFGDQRQNANPFKKAS